MGFEGVRHERRYDPNEYARKKQAKMERAKKLRNKRMDGTAELDDECTFAPKYVAPPSRSPMTNVNLE